MGSADRLTTQFEAHRPRLRGVAYRLLGSANEAEDAVQEAWLRLHRADASTVENLGGWLTTVVSRVCLDILRARKTRREEPLGPPAEAHAARGPGANPEADALLADSVGAALLVVLQRLTPAERLAFVLHDLFALPFDQVGQVLDRTPAAAKMLASRARRRVRGPSPASTTGLAHQQRLVDAFMEATRTGDLQGLLTVLAPDAVLHIDAAARLDGVTRVDAPPSERGLPRELTGAATWAPQMIALSRGVTLATQAVLIDGAVGLVMSRSGQIVRALTFRFADGRITRIDAVGDAGRLRRLAIALL